MPDAEALERDKERCRLRRAIRALRAKGKTWDEVCAATGLSSSTARYYGRSRVREPGEPPKRVLSVRQKMFARGLAEGKSAIASAIAAGSPNRYAAADFASRTKNDPRFVVLFNDMLEKAGLGENELAEVLKRCLAATKIAGIAIDKESGKISDSLEVPDYPTQLNAVRTGFELHNRLGRHQETPAHGHIHFHLTREQLGKYEQITGGPLPFPVTMLDEPGQGEAYADVRHERAGAAVAVGGDPGGPPRDETRAGSDDPPRSDAGGEGNEPIG